MLDRDALEVAMAAVAAATAYAAAKHAYAFEGGAREAIRCAKAASLAAHQAACLAARPDAAAIIADVEHWPAAR